MARYEQQQGKDGERLAATVLRSLEIGMVERIGTPIKAIPRRNGGYDIIWGEKVSGDFRGIMPDGRSVLVECKAIFDRNLTWSDLREHQPGRLDEHASLHGLSLLVWVSDEVYVMEWPVPDFAPRKGITQEQAREHDKRTRKMLEEYKTPG